MSVEPSPYNLCPPPRRMRILVSVVITHIVHGHVARCGDVLRCSGGDARSSLASLSCTCTSVTIRTSAGRVGGACYYQAPSQSKSRISIPTFTTSRMSVARSEHSDKSEESVNLHVPEYC